MQNDIIFDNWNFKNENQIYDTLKSQTNIQIKRIEKITPTLEDVFIHLLEKDKK